MPPRGRRAVLMWPKRCAHTRQYHGRTPLHPLIGLNSSSLVAQAADCRALISHQPCAQACEPPPQRQHVLNTRRDHGRAARGDARGRRDASGALAAHVLPLPARARPPVLVTFDTVEAAVDGASPDSARALWRPARAGALTVPSLAVLGRTAQLWARCLEVGGRRGAYFYVVSVCATFGASTLSCEARTGAVSHRRKSSKIPAGPFIYPPKPT